MADQAQPKCPPQLRTEVDILRRRVLEVASFVKSLKDRTAPLQDITNAEDRGEAIANVQLAYRHLEDARMRLGKVLQAADGGTSIYDK